MKTIKTWLATIAVLLCCISTSAYDFEVDGLCYNILSAEDRTVEVTGRGIFGDIIIPSNVRFKNIDFTVTRIADRAFSDAAFTGDEYITTSILLPNTIVSIGNYAFQYCLSLKEISIPEGVTTIEPGTFMGCGALEKVKLSTNTTFIGKSAFKDCVSLKPFDFLEMLNYIDEEAFENCVNLTYFKVPSSLTIGDKAFRNSAKIFLLQPWGWIDCHGSPFDAATLCILRHETTTYDYDGDGIDDIWSSYDNYGMSNLSNCIDLRVSYDASFTDEDIDYILETGGRVKYNGVEYRITSLLNTYTMEVFDCNNGITTADIASKINYLNREFTVTKIKESAFANSTTLTTVKIPNSINTIENNAFAGCTALSKVTTETTIPLSIKEGCFDAMAQLFATLYVPAGAVNSYKSAAVWKGFGNIVAIINQSSTIDSGTYTSGNTEITWEFTSDGELKLEGTGCIPNIYNAPWKNYQSEIKKATVGEGITSIDYNAFSSFSNLTSITIPKSVTSIDGSAFYGCNNLISFVVEEGNLVYDSRNNCNAIIETETNRLIRGFQTTIIPNSVTSIGWTAFSGCTELTDITIPEGVTSIGGNAFNGCENLTRITIPSSITNIDSYAFKNTNLPIENNIRYAGTWAVEVTDDTKDKYVLRNNTTGIANGTFNYCTNLASITIPESVTSIGNFAFSGCSSLTSINIPEGVTSIGQSTFSNTNLPVENNIRYAGTWAVGVTDNTKDKYTLRDNTTGIADYMFENCSMTEITLPNNLKYIGNYVCVNCRNLTSLTIPNSVISIGEAAFMNCWQVPSITIPSSVTSIGERAFTGRGNGTSIVVDANNTVYDSRGNCNAIICTETNHLIVGCSTTIIPNSVTSIGEWAFLSCGITSVIIPNGVTRIEYATFAGSWLTFISIPSSVTSIEQDAFADCRSLKTIVCRNVVPPTCEEEAFRNVDMGACALEVPLNSVALYRETSPWSGFNISAIVPQTLVLNDGEVFENEENMIVEEITYTRTFKNTNWQALYVPFEIPVTEEFLKDFEVAKLNDVRQYDRDDDGEKDETVIESFKMTKGTLRANYPYLIRAKEAGEKTITVTDATLYAAEEISIDCSSISEKFTFTGTYSRLSSDELPQGQGYYALSGGIWQPVAENASLGAFRFYLKVESRDGLNSNNKAIRMRIIGEDGTTEISELELSGNSQQSTVMYDLQGRRINDTSNLKGLYIVNGKKVMF